MFHLAKIKLLTNEKLLGIKNFRFTAATNELSADNAGGGGLISMFAIK